MENNPQSLQIAKEFLGKEVEVVFDRPLGSKHPKHGFVYEVNYGYIEGVKAPDGEELDAYYLGVDKPLEKAKGLVTAVVHRLEDDDDKLIVVSEGVTLTDEEIEKAVHFQEQWFKHEIMMAPVDEFGDVGVWHNLDLRKIKKDGFSLDELRRLL